MGILFGFAPWILYWVLVANVPFLVAALTALTVAVVGLIVGHITRTAGRTLQIGSVATFLVLTAATVLLSRSLIERWALLLSIAGVFLVASITLLIEKPFVREFAAAGQPAGVTGSDLFGQVIRRLMWVWIAVFGGMAVSSAIPPIAARDATILDTTRPLSVICFWVVPFSLFGLGALATTILPQVMLARAGDIVRKTTFVAYGEATIDELYYLAQEHANREVGPGEQAYDVKVGSMGTPLVGDDTRQSWPSTYKVRQAR